MCREGKVKKTFSNLNPGTKIDFNISSKLVAKFDTQYCLSDKKYFQKYPEIYTIGKLENLETETAKSETWRALSDKQQ